MPLRRGWLLLLVAALLWAPLLGQLHRGSHGLSQADHASHAHAHDGAHAAVDAHDVTAAAAWSAFLFNHDDGSKGCRLYDQLSCADVLGTLPQLVLPLLLTAFLFRRLERNAVSRRAVLFQARGPPVLR
jgi:hypothetical protein